jgi:hypothetical protein
MLAYAFPRALDKDMAKMVERRVEEEEIKLIMNRSGKMEYQNELADGDEHQRNIRSWGLHRDR